MTGWSWFMLLWTVVLILLHPPGFNHPRTWLRLEGLGLVSLLQGGFPDPLGGFHGKMFRRLVRIPGMVCYLVIPGSNINILVPVFQDKGVFKQLLILRPVLVVLEQTVVDKLPEFWGELRR